MKLACLLSLSIPALSLAACVTTDTSDDTETWRSTIVANPADGDGCYHATYPDMGWEQTDCTTAPSRAFTVGNGADFALVSSKTISKASGTFVKATGVKTETDSGTKNGYSIQMNSNFMSGTKACEGVSGCVSWAQFVYSSEEESAFIQNWLIGIGTCPDSSWFDAGGGDCFKNSAAVSVPVIGVTDLAALKMSGAAVAGKNDSMVFANGTEAFSTSEKDTVTNLASAWNSVEYNIIGDGGASEAVFNKGSSIEVRIGVKDGTTAAPQCVANDGTTGETNNLKLGSCKAFVGSTPAVEFTESD
jgi:hypothetical protein|nr:hypothetical protein [Kofleriaceae bacterium]